MRLTNSVAPLSDVWRKFRDGIVRERSLRRAVSNAALALAEATAETSGFQTAGVVEGKTGDVGSIQIPLQTWFRPDKLIIVETVTGANGEILVRKTNTSLLFGAFVGVRNQLSHAPGSNAPIHCVAYGAGAHGNELHWDAGHPGQTITLQFEFQKDCKVYATLFGEGVVS